MTQELQPLLRAAALEKDSDVRIVNVGVFIYQFLPYPLPARKATTFIPMGHVGKTES